MIAPHVTVIAEAGVNHIGRTDLAIALIDAAAAAGADVVKFQTFSSSCLATAEAGMADYQKRNIGRQRSQIDMLRELEIAPDIYPELLKRCRDQNIEFLSSPFDMESLRFLVDDVGLATIKIPSGEITNGPFLLAVGRTGRRAILSTGMAEVSEIAAALDLIAAGYLGLPRPTHAENISGLRDHPEASPLLAERVTLLQCTTEYPAAADTINLRAMDGLRTQFKLPVGLSDHSEGIAVPIAAAALGAVVVEKHLTLDRSMSGPDHKASIEPDEFAEMVKGIRTVEQALGKFEKTPHVAELANRAVARKSLVATRPIRAGAIIQAEDLAVMRPGTGVSPMEFWRVVGSAACRDFRPGELLEWPTKQ